MHYDPHTVLHRVDAHVGLTLLLGGVALLCNYAYFYEAARCAARDRCVPLVLFATTLFFAHDASYLLHAGRWFNGHWFSELFWFGLIVTFAFELIFIAQTIRFGRAELAPRLSQRAFTVVVIGAVVAGTLFWALIKETLDDPLYLMSFMVTAIWCLPSASALLLRRGDSRGQSVRQYVAYVGMIATFFLLCLIVFGRPFHETWFVLLCSAALVWGTAQAWALHRLPASGVLRLGGAGTEPSLALRAR